MMITTTAKAFANARRTSVQSFDVGSGIRRIVTLRKFGSKSRLILERKKPTIHLLNVQQQSLRPVFGVSGIFRHLSRVSHLVLVLHFLLRIKKSKIFRLNSSQAVLETLINRREPVAKSEIFSPG
jgi:hypothetical protein